MTTPLDGVRSATSVRAESSETTLTVVMGDDSPLPKKRPVTAPPSSSSTRQYCHIEVETEKHRPDCARGSHKPHQGESRHPDTVVAARASLITKERMKIDYCEDAGDDASRTTMPEEEPEKISATEVPDKAAGGAVGSAPANKFTLNDPHVLVRPSRKGMRLNEPDEFYKTPSDVREEVDATPLLPVRRTSSMAKRVRQPVGSATSERPSAPANTPLNKPASNSPNGIYNKPASKLQNRIYKIPASNVQNRISNKPVGDTQNRATSTPASDTSNKVASDPQNRTLNKAVNDLQNRILNKVVNDFQNRISNKVASDPQNKTFNKPANNTQKKTSNKPASYPPPNKISNKVASDSQNRVSNKPAIDLSPLRTSNKVSSTPAYTSNKPTSNTTNVISSKLASPVRSRTPSGHGTLCSVEKQINNLPSRITASPVPAYSVIERQSSNSPGRVTASPVSAYSIIERTSSKSPGRVTASPVSAYSIIERTSSKSPGRVTASPVPEYCIIERTLSNLPDGVTASPVSTLSNIERPSNSVPGRIITIRPSSRPTNGPIKNQQKKSIMNQKSRPVSGQRYRPTSIQETEQPRRSLSKNTRKQRPASSPPIAPHHTPNTPTIILILDTDKMLDLPAIL